MNGPLARSALRGFAWLSLSQALSQALRYVATIVLARLLLPEDFGIIAMTVVVTDMIIGVIDLGFGEAIVQRKEVTASHLSTSFWIGMALGVFFCAITVVISPFVAGFFGSPRLASVLAVSSISFVIAPTRTIHGSLMRKKLDFFRFSIGDIGQGLAYVAISVTLAFAGFGVWSIVIGNIGGQVVLAVLRWMLCRWVPSFTFSVASFKDLRGFGSNIIGSRLVNSFGGRLDYLIGGKFLTVEILGFYYMALRTASTVPIFLSMAVNRVAFSAFSVIQDEDERLRRAFRRSQTYISIFVFPLFVGLAIVAPEFVRAIFGEKWTPSIVPTEILCISAVATSLSMTAGPVARSKGRPDLELKISLLLVALLVPSLLVGVKFGMVGIASGLAVTNIIVWLTIQVIANRLIGLRMRDYLYLLGPALFGSAVMAFALLVFHIADKYMFKLSDVWLLISSVLLGALVYFAALKAARIQALDEMTELVRGTSKPYVESLVAKMPCLGKTISLLSNLILGGK